MIRGSSDPLATLEERDRELIALRYGADAAKRIARSSVSRDETPSRSNSTGPSPVYAGGCSPKWLELE